MSNKIQCVLCGDEFTSAISPFHLVNKHGITSDEYERKYAPVSYKRMITEACKTNTKKEISNFLLNTNDEELSDNLFSSLARSHLRTFSEELRRNILVNMMRVIDERLKSHARSSRMNEMVQKEFVENPWRFKMDTEGKPLSNKELARIASIAQDDLRLSTKAMVDITNQVVQDTKSSAARMEEGRQEVFSGEYDRVEIPEMTPNKREKMRVFLGKMMKEMNNRAEESIRDELSDIQDEEITPILVMENTGE